MIAKTRIRPAMLVTSVAVAVALLAPLASAYHPWTIVHRERNLGSGAVWADHSTATFASSFNPTQVSAYCPQSVARFTVVGPGSAETTDITCAYGIWSGLRAPTVYSGLHTIDVVAYGSGVVRFVLTGNTID